MTINKLEKHQLLLMKESVALYENQPSSLENLVTLTQSLEKSINSLKTIDNDWKEAFRTEWWELEFTSSLMIDNEVDQLSEEDEEAVSIAIKNMKKMLDQALETFH